MKRIWFGLALFVVIGVAGPIGSLAGPPNGTAFTYQGQLKQSGAPANGAFDFRFDLLNVGARVGRVCAFQVAVVNGLFTIDVDFGAAVFDGSALEIQVAVKQHSPGEIEDCSPNTFDPYTPVGPPQPITPAPYALHALSAPNGHALDAADGDPTDVVSVDNDGFVSVGSPTQPTALNVTGGLRVQDELGFGLSLTSGLIQFADPNSLNGVYEYNGGDDSHVFSTGGLPRLFIGGGRVGISTVTPQAKLHVFDSAGVRVRIESATGQAGIAFLSNSTGENVLYSPNGSDDLRFFMGTADRMALTAAGNVGIGTNAPSTKLHVAGDVTYRAVSNVDGVVSDYEVTTKRYRVSVTPQEPDARAVLDNAIVEALCKDQDGCAIYLFDRDGTVDTVYQAGPFRFFIETVSPTQNRWFVGGPLLNGAAATSGIDGDGIEDPIAAVGWVYLVDYHGPPDDDSAIGYTLITFEPENEALLLMED